MEIVAEVCAAVDPGDHQSGPVSQQRLHAEQNAVRRCSVDRVPSWADLLDPQRPVQRQRVAGGASHGFRFIQLPYNLAMPEALFFQNQKLGDEYVSVLEAANKLGITAIASGSLLQGQVARGLPEAIREPQ